MYKSISLTIFLEIRCSITKPQTLFHFCITEADAEEYCHAIGMKFFRKKWKDKTVIISI